VPFALDASVAAAWAFPDEDHPDAEAALEQIRTESATVPALWWFEVRNALVISERRKRLDESLTASFLSQLDRLPIATDPSPVESAVFLIARRYGLSFYDATYVELAKRLAIPLATLDLAMARAAAAEEISLIRATPTPSRSA
jgi:predicted nucleic acid-binding protein